LGGFLSLWPQGLFLGASFLLKITRWLKLNFINNWYVKSLFACIVCGLFLFMMITLENKRVEEAAKNTISEFEVEWYKQKDNFLLIGNYFFNVTNNTSINLKEVSVEATFYKNDGTVFHERKYLAKWDIGNKIQFDVSPHDYQKEKIKGTALREDGSPVILAGKWDLVP
jgi:hypothetical protein